MRESEGRDQVKAFPHISSPLLGDDLYDRGLHLGLPVSLMEVTLPRMLKDASSLQEASQQALDMLNEALRIVEVDTHRLLHILKWGNRVLLG